MTTANPAAPLVLVAEDSRIQARVLEHRLQSAGYRVLIGNDGAAALELARTEKPTVIISDIEMPRMTGYELCRAVKQDVSLQDVPVILLSTLTDSVDIIRGLDAGADNYVTKPYDPKYLLSRVESLLKTPSNGAESSAGAELSVTLAGQTYHVKAGRKQVLNLLISTFENAVEKNHELHRINEQLILAKEKLTEWNRTLESLNQQLDVANQRMSRDLHAAARVQQSLLPTADAALPTARFSWKYTPCDELAGDFLNYFPLDDRHVAMFVVDVSGHGAASALLAVAVGRLLTPHASTSSLLARRASESAPIEITRPCDVAFELNRRFPMETQGDLYFTMVYGVLDTQTNVLNYVVAGHPPIVHVPNGGEPCLLPGDGFAIGMVDGVDFDEHTLQLNPGDRVYFYSDGVPEAMSPELEQFTSGRMLSSLQNHAAQGLSEKVNGLFDSVRTWCLPKGPKDDVSILGCEIAAASPLK